jgi:hypothetical protein
VYAVPAKVKENPIGIPLKKPSSAADTVTAVGVVSAVYVPDVGVIVYCAAVCPKETALINTNTINPRREVNLLKFFLQKIVEI